MFIIQMWEHKSVRVSLILALCLLSFGLIASALTLPTQRRILSNGVSTKAVIVDCHLRRRTDWVDYEYEAVSLQGHVRTYTSTEPIIGIKCQGREGQTIDIVYLPTNPNLATIVGNRYAVSWLYFGLITSLIAFVTAYSRFRREREGNV